ncbi:MAG TPA: ATPase [Pseudomonadaceae bacterium]|nr:ATPase [Pseudomonadaceae bacterium]
MAQTLEHLSRQSATLSSIRGIVHTMKTLAAINANPYEQAAQAIDQYHQTVKKGLAAFVRAQGGARPQPGKARSQLLVVFGSDHGLCGSYNEQLAQQVRNYAQSNPHLEMRIACVGARMANALQNEDFSIESYLLPPANVDGVSRLASNLVERIESYSEGRDLDELSVQLAFTQPAENAGSQGIIRALLPLQPELLAPMAHWPSRALPIFTMEANKLLAALLRSHLFASLYYASAMAMVTENAARLSLMQQAEQAVDERLMEINQEIAQARQDEITHELMDIVMSHFIKKKPG